MLALVVFQRDRHRAEVRGRLIVRSKAGKIAVLRNVLHTMCVWRGGGANAAHVSRGMARDFIGSMSSTNRM